MINIKKIVSTCLVATIAIATISCTKAELENSKEESICPTSTEVATSTLTSSQTSTTTSTTTRTTNTSTDMTTTTTTTTAATTAKKEATTMMNTMIKTEPALTVLTPNTTEPIVFDVEVNEEPTISPVSNYPLGGYWDMTYYSATALGYTSPPCGASGNQLIEGYSVACDFLPYGTLIYIESDYLNGTFRVDDCGTGSTNTIDVYYWDNANVPYNFAQTGRVPITITVIE